MQDAKPIIRWDICDGVDDYRREILRLTLELPMHCLMEHTHPTRDPWLVRLQRRFNCNRTFLVPEGHVTFLPV
jgi:hypothetical protein